MRPLIRHLRESGQLTAGLVLRALLSGNVELFEQALAELSGLPHARVSALVLAGGRCEGPDKAEKQSRQQQAKRVLEQGFAPSVESILQSLLAAQTLADKPEVVARVREMVAKTDPRGAAAAQRGMAARRDYCGDLPQISVPTLIVAGRDDGVRKPIDAETIRVGIKSSRIEIIDDAGHLMNMEQPEVFNQAMWQFLEQLNQ